MGKLKRAAQVIYQEFFTFGFCTPGIFYAQRIANLLPYLTAPRLRTQIYRLGGMKIGNGTVLLGPLRIWGRAPLTLGRNCSINGYCKFNTDAAITIGDSVFLGNDVSIITANHVIGPPEYRAGAGNIFLPVTIEAGAWIAANVTLLPGVTVGAGSIVAAGAVVTRDVAPNTLVGGVPAHVIRELDRPSGMALKMIGLP